MTVVWLWFAGASNYLERVAITTMRPSIIADIPMTEAQFGLLTTSFLWVYALASPFAGFCADRFGRKHVIVWSVFAWSAVTWLTGYARSFQEFLILRALLGLFESMYIPAALALIADIHRGPTRSLATGIHGSGLVLGSVAGGIAGWLAENHGWSYAYILIGLPNMAYALFLAFVLREPEREGSKSNQSPEKVGLGQALLSIASTGSFYLVVVIWCLQGFVGWIIVGWMPTYMYEQFKMAQGEAGFSALGFLYCSQFLALWIGGFLSDRLSRVTPLARILLPAAAFVIAAPVFWITGFDESLGLTVATLIMWGVAAGFLGANMMPIICLVTDMRYRATALGVLNCFTAIFGGASVYLVGALRDAQIGIGAALALSAVAVVGAGALLFLLASVLRVRRTPVAAHA